jgi:hypothetical protein
MRKIFMRALPESVKAQFRMQQARDFMKRKRNLNIAFHKAVEEQDYAKILFLFNAGADVNSEIHGGKSMPGRLHNGTFTPRWSRDQDDPAGYVWSPDDPWEDQLNLMSKWLDEHRAFFAGAPSFDGASGCYVQGITALMRAAAVDHACGKNDKNDEEGDEEGDEGEKEGYDDDRDAVVQPGTLEYKSWRKRRGRRHPRHWVIRLLLMLRADPKIPGGWTLFRESILEFLSMHPSRLSGSSN